MRRIYLIDCPGVVPNNVNDSETDTILKGVVRVENIRKPVDQINDLLERVNPVHVQRTYEVKGWEDHIEFLELLAKRMGKLNKGGEPDISTTAKMVLTDWMRGKLPHFVKPPGWTEARPTKEEEEARKAAESEENDLSEEQEEDVMDEDDLEEDDDESEEAEEE